MTLDIKVT